MWKTPETGELRHRISLESATRQDDDIGGWTLNWTAERTFWAKVMPRAAQEIAQADARTLRRTHEITLRFSTEVQSGKRFIFKGQTLRIISVEDPDGRGAFLVCLCSRTQI